MSNASLKEQLQALALVPPTKEEKASPPVNKTYERKRSYPPIKTKPKLITPPAANKPVWLEQAKYGVELLKAHFPACFKESNEIKPLKIGLKQDLVKALSGREDIVTADKACMVNSVAYYVNLLSYHRSVVTGALRVDLEGNDSTPVTEEEAKYSSDRFKMRMDKKKGVVKPVENKKPEKPE